jgi:hypothetical protein
MRKSNVCLILLGLGLALLALMFGHARFRQGSDIPLHGRLSALVGDLELTDLCLFTEARYTRHLSQADLFSAFQDHPNSLEHFPAGSLAGPRPDMRRRHVGLD